MDITLYNHYKQQSYYQHKLQKLAYMHYQPCEDIYIQINSLEQL